MSDVGEGSMLATTLIELYARLVFSAQATLVVDSLTRRFKGSGATTADLANYLGLPTHIIKAALDEIPTSVCFHAPTGSDQGDEDVDNDVDPGADDDISARLLRHYVNYRTAIPWVIAHCRRIILQLCRVDRAPAGTAASPAQKSNDATAFHCAGCTGWFDAVTDLRDASGRCAICNNDIVASTLEAARAAWDLATSAMEGSQAPECCAMQSPDGHPIPRLLRVDRCVVQQALALRYLFGKPFCFVDAHHAVVDPDAVMTLDEFTNRAQHRSSLALQFRAKHRSGRHVHVKLERGVLEREQAAILENTARLEKRRALPPWLGGGDDNRAPLSSAGPLKRQRTDVGESLLSWECIAAHARAVVARRDVEVSQGGMDVAFDRTVPP